MAEILLDNISVISPTLSCWLEFKHSSQKVDLTLTSFSWVPDWTSLSLSSHLIQQLDPHISQVLDEATSSAKPYYSCGFPTDKPFIRPNIGINGQELKFSGYPLAQIEALSRTITALSSIEKQGEPRFPDLVQESINGHFFNRIEAIAKPLPDRYRLSEERTHEALCRTLVGNVWKSPSFVDGDRSWSTVYNLPWTATSPAPPTIIDTYNHIREQWSNGVYAPLGIDLSGFLDGIGISQHKDESSTSEKFVQTRGYQWTAVDKPAFAINNKMGEEFGKMYQFLTNCYGAMAGKQLARTYEGHLCLVPQLAKEDDLIVVVPGLAQPQVLRQTAASVSGEAPETWEFVGSCYVHGIMNGEFWRNVSNATEKPFTII